MLLTSALCSCTVLERPPPILNLHPISSYPLLLNSKTLLENLKLLPVCLCFSNNLHISWEPCNLSCPISRIQRFYCHWIGHSKIVFQHLLVVYMVTLKLFWSSFSFFPVHQCSYSMMMSKGLLAAASLNSSTFSCYFMLTANPWNFYCKCST